MTTRRKGAPRRVVVTGMAATIALLAGLGTTSAQGTGEAAGTVLSLSPIVVSASRVPLPAERVGSAVTVITAEEIERRGDRFVADILRDVPGLAVNRTGAAGALTAVRIRGAEADHTLVIVDGVEVNDPSAGSDYDFARLMAQDIERIEILRGPQSALWGSDAIGGVINIVTKRGDAAPSGSVEVEGGSFGTRRTSAALRGGGERFNLSGSVQRYRTDGISNAAASRGNHEADGYKNDTASLKGSVRPIDEIEVEGMARYTRAFFETDGFTGGPGAFDQIADTTTRQKYGRIGVTVDPFDGTWTHRASLAYTGDRDESTTNGTTSSTAYGTKVKQDYETTVRFDTPDVGNAEHVLTFLAEREKERMEASFLAQDEISTTNDGFAGEYNLGLWDALYLSGSLRRDESDRFDGETTYRGTAAYVVDDWGTRFHGSYGTGIKNPTLTELFGYTNNFVGNPNLKPERARGWDIGVEQRFWDDRARIDVTYFRNRVEDLITGSGNTAINLNGTSPAEGVEITGDIAVTDAIDLSAAYTYTDAETATGVEQVRRPTHTASMSVNWRFLEDRANLNLGVDYTGAFTDFAFSPTYVRSIVEMEAYTLVSLQGSYEVADGVELFARGENLLDEDYEEVFTYGTAGRAGYAGLRLSF
ncbi:TonB-dependent receptor [Marivibrio halodurans]|uniref:TonB-dependent receptor n=1 Tax=Marivibrio halodurans TaxID=2039722 RepID=A0A8J7S616_9PROT|nr:TonB-dependent receptor [Marivibrio halodurans]MBP5856237.1 TonB-dependent receptor [Marivibrio halodurans]